MIKFELDLKPGGAVSTTDAAGAYVDRSNLSLDNFHMMKRATGRIDNIPGIKISRRHFV